MKPRSKPPWACHLACTRTPFFPLATPWDALARLVVGHWPILYTKTAGGTPIALSSRLSDSSGEILYGSVSCGLSMGTVLSFISAPNESMRHCLVRRQDARYAPAFPRL